MANYSDEALVYGECFCGEALDPDGSCGFCAHFDQEEYE